ncbi:MAG: hypothetical protein ABEN55_06710 [Bradymonadaceae bacterium]
MNIDDDTRVKVWHFSSTPPAGYGGVSKCRVRLDGVTLYKLYNKRGSPTREETYREDLAKQLDEALQARGAEMPRNRNDELAPGYLPEGEWTVEELAETLKKEEM